MQRKLTNENYINSLADATTDQYLFQQSVAYFTGYSKNGQSTSAIGLMGNIMYDIQFWNNNVSTGAGTANYMNEPNLAAYMVANPTWLTTSYLPAMQRDANQQEYQNNLVSLSGAEVVGSCSQPYQCVQAAPVTDSSQLLMYQQLYNALISDINTQGYNNYIPLYDQYNDTLMQAYQQTVFALQDAYFLEYLNNQVNYNNALEYINGTSTLNQSLSYGNITSTIFYIQSDDISVGESTSALTQQYIDAQQQLTMLFAAYINQAYENTLEYIVTDKIVGAQTYPTGSTTFVVNGQNVTDNNPPSYDTLLSSGVMTNGSTVQSPLDYLINNLNMATPNSGVQGYTSALSTSLYNLRYTITPYGQQVNSTMLYQYYGLNNIRQWAQSISSYNTNNTESSAELLSIITANYESAPQLFIDGSESFVQFNQAFANGYLATPTGYPIPANTSYQNINQTLNPYYAAPGNYPQPTVGNVTNNINISACNPEAVGKIPGYNLYWYVPNGADGTFSLGTESTPYLMCGNWQTAQTEYNPGNGIVSYTASNGNYGYLLAHILTFVNTAQNSWGQVTFTNNPGSSSRITFMNTTNANNFSSDGVYSGNFIELVPGNSYDTIFAGYFGPLNEKYDYVAVPAAVQTTFPDGFVASFGINPIQNSNIYDTNTLGVSYNPNLDIVQINGQSLNSESDAFNYPGNPDGMPTIWAPAILNVTLPSTDPTGNNTYVSGLVLNGNLLFVSGAPLYGASFNGYTYNSYNNMYLSLNPVGFTPSSPSPYGITYPNCEWLWQDYKNFYELPTFLCTLTSYW